MTLPTISPTNFEHFIFYQSISKTITAATYTESPNCGNINYVIEAASDIGVWFPAKSVETIRFFSTNLALADNSPRVFNVKAYYENYLIYT